MPYLRWFGYFFHLVAPPVIRPGGFRQPGPIGLRPSEFHSEFGEGGPGANDRSLRSPGLDAALRFGDGNPAAPGRPGPIGIDFGEAAKTTPAKKKNPPPTTHPSVFATPVKQPAGMEYSVTIAVIDDTVDGGIKSEAETDLSLISWEPPKLVAKFESTTSVPTVSSITGVARVSAVFRIQTSYKVNTNEKYLLSGYGRGTTSKDIREGNVTLGFHESCHRADFIEYFSTQTLPTLTVDVGMPAQDYNDQIAAFYAAIPGLQKIIGAWSVSRTDEVGATKAKWHKRKSR